MRSPVRALSTFLLAGAALAGGGGPTVSRLPTPTVDARLLGVPLPRPVTVPASTAEILGFFPAYLQRRLPPSPALPVTPARLEFSPNRGVVIAVHSVADLLALNPAYSRRDEVREEVRTLRAIHAGTLDPRRLTARVGSAALGRPHLPYLFDPFRWQWAAGAVKRMELLGGIHGVRFLVLRGGDSGFYSAEMAEYTFQGLSADGRFYVTLTAPYAPVGVPTRAEVERRSTREQLQDVSEATYDADAHRLQRALEAGGDTETVRLLDRVVASLRLH